MVERWGGERDVDGCAVFCLPSICPVNAGCVLFGFTAFPRNFTGFRSGLLPARFRNWTASGVLIGRIALNHLDFGITGKLTMTVALDGSLTVCPQM